MVTRITQTLLALNFLMNSILICNCHFQIVELCHILKGYSSYLMIFSCSLEMRYQHILSFFCLLLLDQPPHKHKLRLVCSAYIRMCTYIVHSFNDPLSDPDQIQNSSYKDLFAKKHSVVWQIFTDFLQNAGNIYRTAWHHIPED